MRRPSTTTRAQDLVRRLPRLQPSRARRATARLRRGCSSSASACAPRASRSAVVTSKSLRRGRAWPSRWLALEPLLDVVVTSDRREHHKPEPEPILEALRAPRRGRRGRLLRRRLARRPAGRARGGRRPPSPSPGARSTRTRLRAEHPAAVAHARRTSSTRSCWAREAEPMAAERAAWLRHELERHNRALPPSRTRPRSRRGVRRALPRAAARSRQDDPELRTPDSPTQRVGGRCRQRASPRSRHLQPMLSLANARDADELLAWDARVRRLLEAAELTTRRATSPSRRSTGSPSRSSTATACFERGATRGDGDRRRGRHRRTCARCARSRCACRSTSGEAPPALVEVRGEVYLPIADFERLNEERAARRAWRPS